MANKKVSVKYYFSVEGETEKWYLEWLRDLINSSDNATKKIALDCKIQKNPLSRAKGLVNTEKIEIYHFSDYEDDDELNVKNFIGVMDQMKKATQIGKAITYRFGYSNFTFDLWMVLHKLDCSASQTHRKNYLTFVNKAFGEKFDSMVQFKHENAFKGCLKQLSISDVKRAIERSKLIMQRNKEAGYVLHQYKGFSYYKENPSLAVWEAIEKMLNDVNMI